MPTWFDAIKRVISETTVEMALIAVGLVTTALSIWYTTGWHLHTGDPLIIAIPFSASIVIFLVILFEFGVRQWINGKRRSAIFLFVSWLFLVSYSMQNTVAAQYLGVLKDREERSESVASLEVAADEIGLLRSSIAEAEASLAADYREQDSLQKALASVESVEKDFEYRQTTARTRARADAVRTRIETTRRELERLRNEVSRASLADATHRAVGERDIFAFYTKVLGIKNPGAIELSLAIFKGVILDLMNVICFMVVMLREKWKEEEAAKEVRIAEEKKKDPEERRKSAAELLAETFEGSSSSRNGMFISQKRAFEELGVSARDYNDIVRKGILSGMLARKGGRVYRNSEVDPSEFLKEVLG